MFTAIVFVALYTAQLTSTLTVKQIRGEINGPADLPGKRVGALANSTGVAYLRARNAQVAVSQQMDQMYQALLDKKVDALLFGAASLRYFSAHEGKGLVRLVGPEFDKEDVAFPFPIGSTLRREVNSALLALREDGTYQRIYEKWFGQVP
jgi:polar amino acid transport system substrate-binding protein